MANYSDVLSGVPLSVVFLIAIAITALWAFRANDKSPKDNHDIDHNRTITGIVGGPTGGAGSHGHVYSGGQQVSETKLANQHEITKTE